MHDPRIGRFFAVDPLTAEYPYYTPYSFSGNQVIHTYELEGLEPMDELGIGDHKGIITSAGHWASEHRPITSAIGDGCYLILCSVGLNEVDNYVVDMYEGEGTAMENTDQTVELATSLFLGGLAPGEGALPKAFAKGSKFKGNYLDEVVVTGKKINGNSLNSVNSQHGYNISIKGQKNSVVKTGISGGKIGKKTGKSYRAERQVRRWNRQEKRKGSGIVYESEVVYQNNGGKGARGRAIKWEAENAAWLRSRGQLIDPTKHSRP